MYLLDTNIWLERLLGQEESESVGQLLTLLPTSEMIMSDFTLHSIGVILGRLEEMPIFGSFVQDVVIDGGVRVASISPLNLGKLTDTMNTHKLDFDDAYQYVLAAQESARIVSFDKDFNRTPERKLLPAQVIATLQRSE